MDDVPRRLSLHVRLPPGTSGLCSTERGVIPPQAGQRTPDGPRLRIDYDGCVLRNCRGRETIDG